MREANLQQFWEEMKDGVYNFTKEGKCSRCGNCCSSILPVTNDELKTLRRYYKKNHVSLTKKHGNVFFDMTCPFYNEPEKKCNVYDVRPQICRDFKCDKPQHMIEATRDGYLYDSRFHVVNLRDFFGVN